MILEVGHVKICRYIKPSWYRCIRFLEAIYYISFHILISVYQFVSNNTYCVRFLVIMSCTDTGVSVHDDVIKWKHLPRYWPFVLGIHRSPVNSPHKCQWRWALMFSLICVWINGWVNNREAGDWRRYRAHCDVTVIFSVIFLVMITLLTLKQLGIVLKIQFYFLLFFPINAIFLCERSPILWVFRQWELWVLMTWCLAPGHQ